MKTITDLIDLLEQEAEGHHLLAVEIVERGTVDGWAVPADRVVEVAALHEGRSEGYRHALAQARHVEAALRGDD